MLITVSKQDFRAALSAVVPHTNPKVTGHDRIQCYVVGGLLYVQATSGATLALAVVSIWDYLDLTASLADDSFTLSITEVSEIVKVFSPSKDEKESEDDGLQDPLQITAQGDELSFLDIGGLFPGKEYGLPNANRAESYLNIPATLLPAKGRALPIRATLGAQMLKKFQPAAAAYGHPLTLEAGQSAKVAIVSCGESFRGAIVLPDEEVEERRLGRELDEQREGWSRRLPTVIELLSMPSAAAA